VRSAKFFAILVCAGAMVGCANSRDPAKGFRLAGSGDPQRGKAAFVEFGCNSCHEVQGSTNLPSPTIQRVALGGPVMVLPSDGYLVTAIINPVYHAANYPPVKGTQQMPEFASRMTVQQMTDIVIYLKSRYGLGLGARREFP
jgi:sulfur-oxidizing protein SoxX